MKVKQAARWLPEGGCHEMTNRVVELQTTIAHNRAPRQAQKHSLRWTPLPHRAHRVVADDFVAGMRGKADVASEGDGIAVHLGNEQQARAALRDSRCRVGV